MSWTTFRTFKINNHCFTKTKKTVKRKKYFLQPSINHCKFATAEKTGIETSKDEFLHMQLLIIFLPTYIDLYSQEKACIEQWTELCHGS